MLYDQLSNYKKRLSILIYLQEHALRMQKRCNVILHGVPVSLTEQMTNSYILTEHLQNVLKYSLLPIVSSCYKMSSMQGNDSRPATSALLIKFINYNARTDFLTWVRSRRLNNTILGGNGKEYITAQEHLTSRCAYLLRQAGRLRQYGYKFVWAEDNQIHIQKDEISGRIDIISWPHLRNILRMHGLAFTTEPYDAMFDEI